MIRLIAAAEDDDEAAQPEERRSGRAEQLAELITDRDVHLRQFGDRDGAQQGRGSRAT